MTTKKQRLLFGTCSFIAMASLSFAWMYMGNASAATVDDTNPTTFEMVDGMSIRNDEYAGIRFRTVVAASYDGTGKTFGTIVVPKALLDEAEITDFTHATAEAADVLIQDIPVAVWDTANSTADKKVYNAVLWDTPASQYATEVVARSYVLENGQYTYTTNSVTRSCAQVAAAELAEGVADNAQGTLVAYVDSVAQGVTLDKATASLAVGDEVTLAATTAPAEWPVVWSSSNKDVLTVSGGVVTAVAAGEATVTASFGSKTATCTVKVLAEQTVKLDELVGFTKPVIEAGRFIDSNRAVKTDAFVALDMSLAEDALGVSVEDYTATTLTVGGVEVATAASSVENSVVNYAPNTLIASLKNLTLGYGDDKAAELVFVGENAIINAQFSVDVVGMLIKNADDLDFMLTAAQGLCYTGYETYGGFNGSAGNALGVYKLANDVYYKDGNAAREYSAQYLTRIKLNSSFNNPKFYPVAMKDDQPGGFQGTFDGCGHVIYDLEFAAECFGLLGGTVGEHTVIKNVAFVNAKHDGWYAPLGIHQYGGTIQDVYMQIDMTVADKKTAPSTHPWPAYADYPNAGFKASEENTPTSENAQSYRSSAAIVSYAQGGSALSRAPKNERIIVEYLNYVHAKMSTYNDFGGYPFASVDISTSLGTTLKNIYAVGTLPKYNLTSADKQSQRFKDSGAYATTADLKAASIDFSAWEGDFWTLKDGVPAPKNYTDWTGVAASTDA